MKIGDRVRFTPESILWLYYTTLWPDSVGVVDRDVPGAPGRVDVRFGDATIVRNEPRTHFKPA